MRLIRGLTNLKMLSRQVNAPLAEGCVATIGNFDGVHLGHQTIIDQVKRKATALSLPSVVMVLSLCQGNSFRVWKRLPAYGVPTKLEALLIAGIDIVLCVRFDETFRSYSAMEFINNVLIDGLAVRHLVVGDDFRFGCDRAGILRCWKRWVKPPTFPWKTRAP